MSKDKNNIRKLYLLILGIVIILCCFSVFIKNKYSYNIVFHEQTQFGDIWVTERDQFRLLSFDFPPLNVQSRILIDNPDILTIGYTQFITTSILFYNDARNILIIGLGGGAIPRALSYLLPDATIDIVELNPKIVDISHRFFHFNPSLHNKIHVEDGIKFVNDSANGIYDIIILDAFNEDYIPSDILSSKFMKQISRIATNDGLVLFNGFTASPIFKLETNLFEQNFKTVYSFIIDNNRIIISTNRSDINFDPKLILDKYKNSLSKIGISPDSLNEWYRTPVIFTSSDDTKTL